MLTDHIYLAHHGIKGMKWGVRRFQNEDGSLTAAGKQRYGEANPGMNRDYRTRQVQRVGAQWDRDNARINRKYYAKASRAERKLEKAVERGASSQRIERLQKKSDRAKIKAEMLADRNEQLKNAHIDYAKKNTLEKAQMSKNWEVEAYNEATSRAMQKAVDKYGAERVDGLYVNEERKAAAAAALLAVGYVAVSALDEYYNHST